MTTLPQDHIICQGGEELLFEYLSDISKKDAEWDIKKAQLEIVSRMFLAAGFEKYALRTSLCCGYLRFVKVICGRTRQTRIKLNDIKSCDCRNCTLCQWRRTLFWMYRYFEILPELCVNYSTARFLFVTLTVPNCNIQDLRETIKLMNSGWKRFIERKELSHFHGWIRTTEVTKGKDGQLRAHPHFHVLILAKPGYFSNHYLNHARWLSLWQESMRDFSITQVDIRTPKNLRKEQGHADIECDAVHDGPNELATQLLNDGRYVGAYVLKYAVKPADLVGLGSDDPESVEWFGEYTRQVHKLRFVATGGVFKQLFSKKVSKKELITLEDENSEKESDIILSDGIVFNWNTKEKRYKRTSGK